MQLTCVHPARVRFEGNVGRAGEGGAVSAVVVASESRQAEPNTVFRLRVRGCNFTANRGAARGGGLYVNGYSNADVEVRDTLFESNIVVTNDALGDPQGGGGMMLHTCGHDDKRPLVSGCTFVANNYDPSSPGTEVPAWGGGMLLEFAPADVESTTFRGNVAQEGGGFCQADTWPSVVSPVIVRAARVPVPTRNACVEYLSQDGARLTVATFASNVAENAGGGLYVARP